jgi:phosphoglycolate phosphatase
VSWGYAPIEALRRVAPEREFGTPAELLHIVRPPSHARN